MYLATQFSIFMVNKPGVLAQVLSAFAEEKVNIAAIDMDKHEDATISVFLTLETRGLPQLSRLLARIEGARGVTGITRLGDESTRPRS